MTVIYKPEMKLIRMDEMNDREKMRRDLRHAMETQFRYKFYNSTEFPFLPAMGIKHVLQGFEAPPEVGFIGMLHLWWSPEDSGIVYDNPRPGIVPKGTWHGEWFDNPEAAIEVAVQIQSEKIYDEVKLLEVHMNYVREGIKKRKLLEQPEKKERKDVVYN